MNREFKIPGFKSVFHLDDPIIPDGDFYWHEATHDGQRLPQSKLVAENILALAKRLQPLRDKIGKPFHITSWYRPEPFNSRAGGARFSQHLDGKAVDFYVDGYRGFELAVRFAGWDGGLGTYLHLPDIIHLDIGLNRRW